MTDRIILACIGALAVVYFYGTRQIPVPEIGDPLGPKAFPYLLTIGLLVTGGLLLAEIMRAGKRDPAGSRTTPSSQDRRYLLVISMVAFWTALYFSLFQTLGYVVDTVAFLFGLMVYFHPGRRLTNLLIALLFAATSYVLFARVLGVALPRGVLPL